VCGRPKKETRRFALATTTDLEADSPVEKLQQDLLSFLRHACNDNIREDLPTTSMITARVPPLLFLHATLPQPWRNHQMRNRHELHNHSFFGYSFQLVAIILHKEDPGHFVTVMRIGSGWCLADDLRSDEPPVVCTSLDQVQVPSTVTVSAALYVRQARLNV